MDLAKLELTVPKEMLRFLTKDDEKFRNAMLIYPAVRNGIISRGKAAEIIGIPKLDLLDIYGEIDIPYYDTPHDEVLAEAAALTAWLEKERELDRGQ